MVDRGAVDLDRPPSPIGHFQPRLAELIVRSRTTTGATGDRRAERHLDELSFPGGALFFGASPTAFRVRCGAACFTRKPSSFFQ